MSGKFSKEITREWIAHALREFGEPIPDDATLVGMEYSAERDVYKCVFESEKTKEVLEGSQVYELSELKQ